MKIPSIFEDARKMLDRNSPVILTGMAVGGTLLSVYLTYKGTQKGTETIRVAAVEKMTAPGYIDPANRSPLSNQEKFLLTYKFYAPAAAAVVGTSVCMVMATRIGLDRTAALAGALIVTERTNDQYKAKVKELFGENKNTKAIDAVAQDQINSTPEGKFPTPSDGKQVFMDAWSGQIFVSDTETIKQAVNDFNHEMLYGSYCSLNDLYKRLGLEEIQEGGQIGWNKDDLLEVVYTSTLTKKGQAVVVMSFDKKPFSTFLDKFV
jgi:hypothetical protein